MLLARLSEDGNWVVVKIDNCHREQRMTAGPQAFFTTQCNLNNPMMIARLSTVDNLRELFADAWKHAAK